MSPALRGVVVLARRNADEVVGEQRQVVGGERGLVEVREDVVVLRLDVAAVGLQLGDRDRLHRAGEHRQALAVGARGGGAVGEAEGELRRGSVVRRRVRHRTAGRAGRQALPRCGAGAPRKARRAARGEPAASTWPRSRTRPGSRHPPLRAAPPGGGPAAEWMKAARRMSSRRTISRPTSARKRLAFSRCAASHRCVTTSEGMRRSQSTTQPSSSSLSPMPASTKPASGSRGARQPARRLAPQLRQRRRGGRRRTSTRISRSRRSAWRRRRSPLDPAGGDLAQDLVDHRGQRTNAAGIGAGGHEHDREVVAQPRQVAVARE